jgi:hypothetical protein
VNKRAILHHKLAGIKSGTSVGAGNAIVESDGTDCIVACDRFYSHADTCLLQGYSARRSASRLLLSVTDSATLCGSVLAMFCAIAATLIAAFFLRADLQLLCIEAT